MKANYIRTIYFFALALLSLNLSAQETIVSEGLNYDEHTKGFVPIPAAERLLQHVTATAYYKVTNEGHVLEGAIFDKQGNLFFCDVSARRVMRLTPDKELSTIVTLHELNPGGLAFHQDGRLFIAALDLVSRRGAILAVNSDGTEMQRIITPEAGFMPNDLLFDQHGGLYFTDFKGQSTDPQGAVYYIAPNRSTATLILPGLAMANGIALSADGKTLWVTEFGRNLLHRILLSDATTIAPIGTAVAYHFTGPAPDSMRADADGNLYVAIYGQGRILVFNPDGIPIGQILYPERTAGHHLLSTSLAINPETNDLYGVTSDGDKGNGATIFHAKSFAKGLLR
ncbi:SMP-30/gluconolactonase/LRE family protein [Sphingobacterium oryzagri]|uniref:SMP-30/gluconolactonase/LRE family protein n=1 Tax=Sphingobacterium oryzagri TaxID=3025669 RepID=A0ABY7WJT3_9SPHI|nr:SMP-30/gluconolactonase/LRE family protein [Sphingobacterium sp. KACC 22765]WDF68653.1 SMP-30/gluconolactonase/LRE family protein [Sphingobacterium sp. KACC 22765]